MNNFKFQIQIDYNTGNSLNKYNKIELLELNFNDINVAKENLKRIYEHYNMYIQTNYYRKDINLYINERWFVKKVNIINKKTNYSINESDLHKFKKEDIDYKIDIYTAQNCIKLISEKNNILQINTFWIGHFESLNNIKIVLKNKDLECEDLEYSF